jgi:ABC-2 type transport system permease protein
VNKFNWLVRRELWEARSVWVAPAVLAAILVVGTLLGALLSGTISLDGLGPDQAAKVHEKLTPEHLDGIAALALGFIALLFLILVMFTQFLYAVDALYGERRDRSILFWKSMPVSDAETVLSKLFVAAVVMPAVAAGIAVATQVVLFAIGSAKLASLDFLQGHLWTPSLWGGSLLVTAYVLVASALWCLPVLGWCMLVSVWAPRSPLMYATLPPFGLALGEWLMFRSHHVWTICLERLNVAGLLSHALGGRIPGRGVGLVVDENHMDVPRTLVETMRPGRFLGSPEVWIGVAVGAALIGAAIWLRRRRDETT